MIWVRIITWALIGACVGLNVATYIINRKTRRLINGTDRQAPTSAQHPQASQGAGYLASSFSYSGAVVSASTFATPESPGVTLEHVDSDQPILAHRAANLYVGRGGLKFRSINNHASFGVDATAICDPRMFGEHGRHPAPAVDCQCGFYACPADIESWHGAYTVDLLVELSGRVIEHEQGYRAEHQRVLECRLPRCPYCRQPTEVIMFVDGTVEAMGCMRHFGDYPDEVTRTEYHYHMASPHAEKVKRHVLVVSRADVEAACPVPVVDDD